MNDLRVFVMVAQMKSIRNAALMLHLSERFVSYTIERLERECNEQLFTRHNRGGVRMTDEGSRLLHHALPMVQAFSPLPI